MNLRDWLDPMCRTWAQQKRRVWQTVDLSGNNILARIREEGAGASHSSGRVVQKHPEVYTGDGLQIQRAIIGMPELPCWVLHVHWIPEPPVSVPKKCILYCLGNDNRPMPVQTYWKHLREAYVRLDTWFARDRFIDPPRLLRVAQNTVID